jgi:hypothetical protein
MEVHKCGIIYRLVVGKYSPYVGINKKKDAESEYF